VKAAKFFLNQGLAAARDKIGGGPAAEEADRLRAFVSTLSTKDTPWNVFGVACKSCNNAPPLSFLDAPEDNIYWKKFRRGADLTRKEKKKDLRLSDRKKVVGALLHKTEVTAYEKQGLEYVSMDKLSDDMRTACAPFRDILCIGTGGGAKTRFK